MNNVYPKASVLTRIIAIFIDFTVSLILLTIVKYVDIFYMSDDTLINLLFIFLLFKDVFGGRSLGKRFFSIYVRSARDQDVVPSPIKLVLRNITTVLMPLIDLLFMIFSTRNLKLGDRLVGCTAIYYVGAQSHKRTNKKLAQQKPEQATQPTQPKREIDVDYSKWDSINKDLQFNQPPDSRHDHIKLSRRKKIDYDRDYIKENDWE